MFMCERCGSRYSARYAVGLEDCPRCQLRGSSSRLSFRAFRLPAGEEAMTPRAKPSGLAGHATHELEPSRRFSRSIAGST